MAKIELLAPAGNMESLISAIKAGANAVYLGGVKFGARSYSNNFDLTQLSEAIKLAHFYDVKVYVTCNTLVFEEEFDEAVSFIEDIHKLGVDAVLIQDLGLLEYCHKVYPNLELHASTQMNVTTLEECLILKEFNVKRIVLGRETPIEEIKRIKQNLDIEIEVFVHGALCVSYSGNCFMSSLNGGRSGNRGKCVGNCRLEYSLENDKGYSSGYLYALSTKDLCTIEYINELKKLKVDSLKIEGRMKRPEYVSQVVSSYRKAIDFKGDSQSFKKLCDEEIYKMKLIFNREFTKGLMFNEQNIDFSNPNQPNHIGINIGKVIKTSGIYAYIKLKHDITNGDSIRFVSVEENLKTTEVDAITINDMAKVTKNNEETVKAAFKEDVIKVKCHNKLKGNIICYITSSKKQLDSLNKIEYPKVHINGVITLDNGLLTFKVYDKFNQVSSSIEVNDLAKSDYSERIKSQLTKTNNIYVYDNIIYNSTINYYVEVGRLNKLRSEVLDKFKSLKENRKKEFKKCEYYFDSLTLDYSYNDLAIIRNSEQLIEYDNIEFKVKNELNNRIQNTLNNNIKTSFSDWYRNICNSYSCYFYYRLGINRLTISLEANENRIKSMVEAFTKRYKFAPNLSVCIYSRYEVMMLRYCPISKLRKTKANCGLCLKDKYYLKDIDYNIYYLERDSYDLNDKCVLKVLHKDICDLRSFSKSLKEYGINSFIFDFYNETKDEIKDILDGYRTNSLPKAYYGHYKTEVK